MIEMRDRWRIVGEKRLREKNGDRRENLIVIFRSMDDFEGIHVR